MDEDARDEVLELDADTFISVEVSREWPRYVATWSIRRRAGDTDFPVKSGRIERMPPADSAELDDMLESLRQEARGAAMNEARTAPEASVDKKGSLLGRIFGRE